ncbi:c-type cytochrome [Schinkia sp. CFF1]
MKNAIIIFLVFALVGFGGGYLFSQSKSSEQAAAPDTKATTEQAQGNTQGATTEDKAAPAPETVAASPEGEIFKQKGCIQCHSIEKLGIKAGQVGPDLSQAYKNVPGKHGKPVNEFLKKPTSAVMSGVIGSNPLTDDEINKIVEALKIASEK